MSLRGRLLLAAATMVLIALVVADLTTYSELRSYLYYQADRSLDAAHEPLQHALEAALTGSRIRQEIVLGIPGAYVEARDGSTGRVIFQSSGGVPVQLPAHIDGLDRGGSQGEVWTHFNAPSTAHGSAAYRVRASTFLSGDQLILAFPLGPQTSTLHRLAGVELAVTALALLTVVALGWWLVRLSFRPLREMEDTAAAIAHGELGRRVPGDTAVTEVGKLAKALNTMLERIQEAFAARDATEHELRQSEERLRRFVADASHELRTPLSAVGAYAELFERGAADRPEDLVRVMSGIRAETARMGELVGDLLLLARLDEGRPLERESVELVGLAAEALEAAVAVGPDWPVQLEATRAVEVTGDGVRLRQVVDNLLSNVRAHTPPGTVTRVRVGAQAGFGIVEVADNGPGLPDQDLGRVFERFYRTDASRSRHSGGSGLGLAIVAAIVEAHGGQVVAGRTDGGGATFTVWLPVAIATTAAPLTGEETTAPDPPPAMANEGPAGSTN